MKRYPKILSLGHELVAEIFDNPVELTEKIDGSQCRVHLAEGFCGCGSKNAGIADQKTFRIAHEQTDRMYEEKMWEGWGEDVTLFCEFLSKEKHNVLKYDRVPYNNLYLFGAIIDDTHVTTEKLEALARDLHIEPPSVLASKKEIKSQDELEEYLTITSVLGGTILEGIVIKNYHQSYPPLLTSTQAFFGYPLAGKIVRNDFKERLDKEWKVKKIKESAIERVTAEFLTEARFNKSIQHLQDEGKLTSEMKDMKVLLPEFWNDLMDEEKDEIIKIAMSDFWKILKKRCDSYVVNNYKEHLIKKQFNNE
jgi:hypothetical protein